MPMIVDPSATPIPAPTEVVSTDGRLRAVVDATWAGVLLVLDGSGDAVPPAQWRVTRTDPDGTQHLVRSADPVWSPGGTGLAYDHEMPPGLAVLYTATPVPAGTSSSVSVTVPAPAFPRTLWLKSLSDPGRSLRAHVESWPEQTSESRRQLVTVPGDTYPVSLSDVYSAPTGTMALYTETAIEASNMRRLLLADDVLHISAAPSHQRDPLYAVLGEIGEAEIGPGAERRWTVPVQPVQRPATLDQSLRIPGWSADDLLAAFATYAAAAVSYADMTALASNGLA